MDDTKYFDNLPCKIFAGVAGGVSGMVAGTVTSIVTIPVGPYLWYKGITSHIDAKNYESLMNQFSGIAIQMGQIDGHLSEITKALGEIEAHLAKATKAEEKVMSFEGGKREKMIGRIKERAQDLIIACDNYFALVKKDSTVSVI